MSIKKWNLFIISLILVVGIGAAAVAKKIFSDKDSAGISVIAKPKTVSTKMGQGIEVGLSTSSSNSAGGLRFEVVATAKVNRSFQGNLSFNWRIGQGYSILEGDSQGTWSNVVNGQVLETRLVLEGANREDLPAIFEAFFIDELGRTIKAAAVVSARQVDVAGQNSFMGTRALKSGLNQPKPKLFQ